MLAFALAAPGPKESAFALRTDPPPKEWRLEEINDGLPYRFQEGVVHLLVWEVVSDNRPHEYTQILVLKRLDKPTEKGGHRWVLAQLYRDYKSQDWPWRGQFNIPPPVLPGQQMPKLSKAQMFGYEFYD